MRNGHQRRAASSGTDNFSTAQVSRRNRVLARVAVRWPYRFAGAATTNTRRNGKSTRPSAQRRVGRRDPPGALAPRMRAARPHRAPRDTASAPCPSSRRSTGCSPPGSGGRTCRYSVVHTSTVPRAGAKATRNIGAGRDRDAAAQRIQPRLPRQRSLARPRPGRHATARGNSRHLHGEHAALRDDPQRAPGKASRDRRANAAPRCCRRDRRSRGTCRRPSARDRPPPFDAKRAGTVARALREHRRRIVDADDPRIGPALGENPRDVAGAAAEVDDRSRRCRADARHEIERRAQPLARVLEILRRVPRSLSLLLGSWPHGGCRATSAPARRAAP